MLQANRGFRLYLETGRVLLALIFILSGFNKLTGWGATEAYMASKGLPVIPLLLFLAVVIELVGGLSILFGYRGRFFGTLIFLYLIPVTLIFHDFWNVPNGDMKMMQMVNFMKNLAIMGGLIQYACFQSLFEPLKARTNVHPENTVLRRTPITT